MVYLILAVLASSAVAIIMRLSEKHAKNSFAMFMANYAVCSMIAFALAKDKAIFAPKEGLSFALLLGLGSGCLYLTSLALMKINISRSGVMLTFVFMKLGVLVPAIMAVAIFRESPSALQILGFVLAIAAIIIIYMEPKSERTGSAGKASILLLVLLVVGGLTESMANIFDKLGSPALKDHFLLFNFFTAFLLSLIVTVFRRERISWKDLAFGAAIGVPNYFATRFLLLSLGSIPAVVVYPIYNVGAIVLISLVGILLFRERLNTRKAIGIAVMIAALILLNL